MKNSVLIVALMLISLTIIAQPPRRKPPKSATERAQLVTDKLDKALALDDDQEASIYDINLSAAKEINQIMKSARDGERSPALKKQVKEKVQAVNQERSASISSKLNEEQRAKFQKIKKEYREKVQQQVRNRRENMKGGADFWDSLENDG